MPLVLAFLAVVVGAAAIDIGHHVGTEAAPVAAVVIPVIVGLVVLAALSYWHRRRMLELQQGRYDLKHDELGWRRITVHAQARWYICRDCGQPCPDLKSSEVHSDWHAELAEFLEARSLAAAEEEETPWSAVTEPDPDGPEPVSYTHLTLPTTPYV